MKALSCISILIVVLSGSHEKSSSVDDIAKRKFKGAAMQSIIHTPTSDIKNSLDFYRRLNFKVISEDNPVMVTDGKAVIEINPDRFARAGLKLYKESWTNEIGHLEKLIAVTKIENGYLVSDPSGVWIYLIEGDPAIDYEKQEKCFGITGNFSGLSLETTDIVKSSEFWETLGFSKTMGDIEQGWAVYTNEDGMAVSLMAPLNCPHLFFNPSMTYFNGDNNLSVIQRIRDAQIPITEEITYFNKEGIVDNIIIRDSGGYGFFIFND